MNAPNATNLTGKNLKPAKSKNLQEIEIKRQALEAQIEEINRQEEAYQASEKQRQKAALEAAKLEANELISQAEQFEKMSIESTTAFDKKTYALEALRLRNEAKQIYPIEEPAKEAAVDEFTETVKWKSFAYYLGGLFAFLGAAWAVFGIIRNKIIAHNASLTIENMSSAMQPYGLDSFQKLAFESFVTAVDLMVMFVIMWIIDKTTTKYSSNLFKTKNNPVTDFSNLTPWQRQLKSLVLVSSVLLYLALRHLVKA